MKKYGENFFQIGELAKILGVTRKALLVYEEKGLITPAIKDKESGYRYYSPENMMQIRSIRALQMMGLSLNEIGEYYSDTSSIDAFLKRLTELRASIDRNIQSLQFRSAKSKEISIHSVVLPRQVCYIKKYRTNSISELTDNLRETSVAAAKTGHMSFFLQMFIMACAQNDSQMPKNGDLPAPMPGDIFCCIPMDDAYAGPDRFELPESKALCLYHRGPYESLPAASGILLNHLRENGIEAAGFVRHIFIEGPPNRGKNSNDYITQVAVPIKD